MLFLIDRLNLPDLGISIPYQRNIKSVKVLSNKIVKEHCILLI